MKNKRGFTLIELIATIGIMVLIGIVIVNNMTGLLSKQNDEDYANFLKELEDSACIYVETKLTSEQRSDCRNSGCIVEVTQLIETGYIEDTLKDPSNGDFVKDYPDKYKVKVHWVDNVKTCEING